MGLEQLDWIKNLRDLACITDPQGYVTLVLDSELKSHLAVGQNILDFFDEDSIDHIHGRQKLKLTQMDHPLPVFVLQFGQGPDSIRALVRDSSMGEYGNDDSVGEYVKVIQDQKYALDQSAIVAITDRKGKIIYVNDKFCEISGYSKLELIGKDHRMINSGYHSKDYIKQLWSQIDSGQVWSGEIKNRAKNGDYYWVHTTIVPLLGEAGQPEQFVAIRFDITSKKQAEEDLDEERARSLNSEKMASLGIMATGIAHELGNPLGALRGRIEMLRDSAKSGSVEASHVERVSDRALGLVDRMNKIIRGLRAYARDGSEDPYENVELYGLIADIVEISSQKSRKLGIKISGLHEGQKVYVQGRETEIGQVFVNLLNNAMDAIQDLPEKWIKIQFNETEESVIICIVDSGRGISSEVESRILDPFFTTKPVGQGTGLGLSISNTIIQSHGGRLFVDKDGPNTSFCIELPKRQTNNMEISK